MAINFNNDNWKVKVSGKDAVVKYEDKNVYAENLPEGIDVKTAKELFKYNSEFINSAVREAVEVNKDLLKDKMKVKIPFGPTGSGDVVVDVEASRDFKNPKSGEVITKPYIRVAVKHTQLKASKSMLKELTGDIATAIANK